MIVRLKNDKIVHGENPEIFYWNYDLDMFINCGYYNDIPEDSVIPPSGILDDIGIAKKVILKIECSFKLMNTSF